MPGDDVVRGYAEGLFRLVQAEGDLARVEDELYRFGKLLETNHELKQALSDLSLDKAQRTKILDELLADRVLPQTLTLVAFVVDQGRGRQLPQILAELSELAAAARQTVVAEVRTAVPLDEQQRKQLADALSKATGKNVDLKPLVDPSVIGGVFAKVGDTVIDGTVRRRLEQLKEQVRS
ncbi:MAG TPA: ATP synthase F1 subunit delta [Actinomycetota bacterium]|nr:ATP synthase F1 subunit delta [Actinomycetota bacterium]